MDANPIKVLLVEDDEDDFIITRDLLREASTALFHLEWVSDFDAALKAFRDCAHDVFLLDYRLDQHNGVELLRHAIANGCKAPVIMLTSQGDHAVDVAAMRAGASDYLVKGQINATLLERSIRYAIERKKNEQALQDINSELESFAYSVSHDLRAPLRAMQGFSQLLLEDHAQLLDPVGRDYVERIVTASARLDCMIRDLLDYSRLSRRDMKIHPVPLSGAVQDALAQLDAVIKERKAKVTVEEPLPEIMSNRTTLVQLLGNLIANAVKFVEPDKTPEVTIRAEVFPESIRLWIVDNGIGIHAKHHERIFRIFERLHGDSVYPGTGIGLAIVKKGIERLGGRVGLESAPGEGSRFYLDLPKLTSPEEPS